MQFAVHNLYRDWTNVIFWDEKLFYSNNSRKRFVQRPNNTLYHENYITKNGGSDRISPAFWGWMSSHDPSELVEINQGLTSTEDISNYASNSERTYSTVNLL